MKEEKEVLENKQEFEETENETKGRRERGRSGNKQ